MHELSVTGDIFQIVLRYVALHRVDKVLSIHLEIGELSDLEEEWIQHYFDKISKGSAAEGAVLKVHKIPCVFYCEQCGAEFEAELSSVDMIMCPSCTSRKCRMVRGDEYTVKSMEVL